MREKQTKADIEGEIDALFALPLEEFTATRNELAARLKKTGHGQDAERVKALAKPSISAWAANQLYWRHRREFGELIAAGERVVAAQASQLAGKRGDMREPLARRREALASLSRLAAALLHEAGNNPTPDKMRRINATLEAISTGTSSASAGRLTEDIDPPGFELFAALPPPAKDVQIREKPSPQEIAAAKAALKTAERALTEAQDRARDARAALQSALAQAKKKEKDKREAEERYHRARAADQEARERASAAAAEAEKSEAAVKEAERAVEKHKDTETERHREDRH